MGTRVVDHRSVAHTWRLNGHRGAINALWSRVVPESGQPKIYTGGDDGVLRVWDAKGHVIAEYTGHTAPITSIFFAHSKIYTGDDQGWIAVWNEKDGRRIVKWRAHEPAEGFDSLLASSFPLSLNSQLYYL